MKKVEIKRGFQVPELLLNDTIKYLIVAPISERNVYRIYAHHGEGKWSIFYQNPKKGFCHLYSTDFPTNTLNICRDLLNILDIGGKLSISIKEG